MLFITTLLLTFLSCIQAISLTGSKTLIIYDDSQDSLDNYSKFLSLLESHSFEVSNFKLSSNDSLALLNGKENQFDNLIIFPNKVKGFNKLVPAKDLLKFFENGGNILSMTSPGFISTSVRVFLNQLGIYPSPRDAQLVDYFTDSQIDDLKISSEFLINDKVFKTNETKEFKFGKTSAALLDNREQIVPILKSSKTSFTKRKSAEPWTAGSQGYVATGFQNLINARAVWVGSIDFFNNNNFKINNEFIEELIKWNFNEKSIVKSVNPKHSHADGTPYDEIKYKVNDMVTYSIGISEWNGEKWIPYIADDVQFELRQIDPYYRLTLKQSEQTEDVQYYTTGDFKLPNRHGMFTFITDYKRSGLSFFKESDVKAIRHLANNEYPRSWEITNAWVYLSAIFGVIAAFVVFVIAFVTTKPSNNKVTVTKKNN